MTVMYVSSSSELSAALKVAKPGDVISLANGNYGDFAVKDANFAGNVTITSQDPNAAAIFNSFKIYNSSNISLDGIDVRLVPTESSVSYDPAILVKNSENINIANGNVVGGNAVNGVSQDATALDATGNVQGLATGLGVSIQNSKGVTVEHMDISHFLRGVGLSASEQVTISGNEIHDLRKTAIFGAGVNDVVIDGNHIHDSNPWKWGQTPLGDHADFIAFWTDPALQKEGSDNVVISNNVMEQGAGTAVLGVWFQGQRGELGFTNVTFQDNTILNGNLQGLTLKWVDGATVSGNTLLQTSGDAKAAPGILLTENTKNVDIFDNIVGAIHDMSGTGKNSIYDNEIVQKFDPSKIGYYTESLVQEHSRIGLGGVEPPKEGGVIVQPEKPQDTISGPVEGPSSPGPNAPSPEAPIGGGLAGTVAADNLLGSAGSDTIVGGKGADTISGGEGADTIVYRPYDGRDVIVDFGVGGHDFLDISAMTAAKLKPFLQDIGDGTAISFANGDVITLMGIRPQDLYAVNGGYSTSPQGGLQVSVTGGAGSDSLVGGDAAESISAGAGSDTIVGGKGADTISGGEGADTIVYRPYDGRDVIVDFGVGGHDFLDISAMTAAKLKPFLQDIGDGTAISFANGDVITLMGIRPQDLYAVNGGYSTSPQGGLQVSVTGGAGSDSLVGGDAAESISAGAGSDTIVGGKGADTISGGEGADTIVYRPYDGRDVIVDFGVGGHDFLDISAMTAAKLKPFLQDIGDGTAISFANGDVITLMGIRPQDLVAVDGGFTI